jgi:superfamily I DNA and/or RNA helicase
MTVVVVRNRHLVLSAPNAFECVDVLFIDEAAQMSLANVLAVSQAAKTIVLLGDPRQLEQPMQGSRPKGTDVSALDHILALSLRSSAMRSSTLVNFRRRDELRWFGL